MQVATKVLASPFNSLEPFPDRTVPQLVLRASKEFAALGKDNWIVDSITGIGYTYNDFPGQTKSIASALHKRGFKKGDCVIYNTEEVACIHIFFTGVWRANGYVRSSYPEDLEETLLQRVKESKATWLLCDEFTSKQCLSVAKSVEWDLRIISVRKLEGCISLQELMDDDGSDCPIPDITPEDPALVLCTSGTTGLSKGAVHSHESILALLNFRKHMLVHCNGEPNLFICKGTHIRGATGPLGTMIVGSLAVVMSKITKQTIFHAVDKYQPIYIQGMTSYVLLLVNEPDVDKINRDSIKAIFGGGGILTPEIENDFLKLPFCKTVLNGYGLTETVFSTGTMDLNYSKELRKIPGTPALSVGKVWPDCEVRVRDTVTGESLGPHQTGEICVKNPNMFTCYFKQPEATAAAFEDGWFRTGDMGYYDENEFIFVVDRVKETFKYFGNHISPFEIENIILKYKGVKEACVIGIPAEGGFVPKAFITVHDNFSVNPLEIKNFANEKLATYKHIRGGVSIIKEFPRGPAGKISRTLLSKLE